MCGDVMVNNNVGVQVFMSLLKAGYTCNNNFLLPPSIFEFFSSMEAWAHFRKMY